MRLMVIGHPFFLAHNQAKYVAMKQIDPQLQLRIVVPSRGRDRFALSDWQIHPHLTHEEVVPLGTYLASSHMTYLHGPSRLAATLRKFQPDVVHIEEEPHALVSTESIFLQRAFAPNAAITMFTWDNLLRRRRFPLDSVKHGLRAYSLRRAEAIVCGNQRAAELLRNEGRFHGIIEVHPQYGLEASEHQPGTEAQMRTELGLEESVVIGYVGRLVREKGLRLLFEALGQLKDYSWKLLLVGSGPLEKEIRERWMAQFPRRIVLIPAVPYEQASRYLRCLDIFVLASYATPSWVEQFGLALAQAMMLGIASIGSRSGAIPEVLGPGGLVFEEGNAGSLAEALQELLRSPTRRAQLGARARAFALANYTSESVAERYLGAFERARKRHSPSNEQISEPLSENSRSTKDLNWFWRKFIS